MLNSFDSEIVRKTLLDFNLADHYVDAIMTELDRRLQLEEIKHSLATALHQHKLTDVMLGIVKDLPAAEPTSQASPTGMYVQYQVGPRPQPYNHDRSQL